MDAAFDFENGHCHGPAWIYKYFGECITSTQQMLAFYVGLASILCWLVAQGPQLITNYKNGNADSLSALFLVQWLIGDSLNLIGSVLSNQQATQIITAYYFVSMDFVMVMQYAFYMIKRSVDTRKRKCFFCVCVFVQMRTHHTHMHTHVYAHTHIHICTHT